MRRYVAVSTMNEWLALLRAHEGRVTTFAGLFLNQGRPVDDYFATTLVKLIRTGNLTLVVAALSGQQQVCVTHIGQLRYVELNSNGVREGRYGG